MIFSYFFLQALKFYGKSYFWIPVSYSERTPFDVIWENWKACRLFLCVSFWECWCRILLLPCFLYSLKCIINQEKQALRSLNIFYFIILFCWCMDNKTNCLPKASCCCFNPEDRKAKRNGGGGEGGGGGGRWIVEGGGDGLMKDWTGTFPFLLSKSFHIGVLSAYHRQLGITPQRTFRFSPPSIGHYWRQRERDGGEGRGREATEGIVFIVCRLTDLSHSFCLFRVLCHLCPTHFLEPCRWGRHRRRLIRSISISWGWGEGDEGGPAVDWRDVGGGGGEYLLRKGKTCFSPACQKFDALILSVGFSFWKKKVLIKMLSRNGN